MNKEGGKQFTYAPRDVQEDWMKLVAEHGEAAYPRPEWEHFTPEFVDTKSQRGDPYAFIKQVNSASEIYLESKLAQKEANIKIDTYLPIGIVHLGDLHLGSIYTDTDEVMRKVGVIQNTPNLYVVFMSNLIDNAIPSQYPANMLANGIPPDKQVLLIQSIVKELDENGKVLGAVTSPCHEGWTYKHTGQDINALIFGYKGRNFPVLQNGGLLNLTVGDELYRGALYHQVGPFESNFNKSHAMKQLHRLNLRMQMDWLAGAHRHVATAENTYEGNGDDRRKVVYLRTGTAKGTGDIHDQFVVDRYGRTGEPTGQTVHLFPRDHRCMGTNDFDDAVMAHESYYVREYLRNNGIKP